MTQQAFLNIDRGGQDAHIHINFGEYSDRRPFEYLANLGIWVLYRRSRTKYCCFECEGSAKYRPSWFKT